MSEAQAIPGLRGVIVEIYLDTKRIICVDVQTFNGVPEVEIIDYQLWDDGAWHENPEKGISFDAATFNRMVRIVNKELGA